MNLFSEFQSFSLQSFSSLQITVNRNQAKIIVGPSSKRLCVQIYPQVTEQWVFGEMNNNDISSFLILIINICLDSIVQGECLPPENYLLQ